MTLVRFLTGIIVYLKLFLLYYLLYYCHDFFIIGDSVTITIALIPCFDAFVF